MRAGPGNRARPLRPAVPAPGKVGGPAGSRSRQKLGPCVRGSESQALGGGGGDSRHFGVCFGRDGDVRVDTGELTVGWVAPTALRPEGAPPPPLWGWPRPCPGGGPPGAAGS